MKKFINITESKLSWTVWHSNKAQTKNNNGNDKGYYKAIIL